MFDHATVYAEDLPWPTGVCCYDGGIFVAASPDIIYFKDTNGDGRADIRKVVFTGFGAGKEDKLNVQALVNGLRWGMDNRLHGQTAGNGGVLKRPDVPDAAEIDLRGRDVSFDPRELDLQTEAGGGQYGMSFDNRGRRFVCSNSHHIQTFMYDAYYGERNSLYNMPPAIVDIPVDGPAAEVYRTSPEEGWRVIRTKWRVTGVVQGLIEGGGRSSGYFTSATGITIYRGDAFPEEVLGDAFIADVGSNLIHRKKVRTDGVALIAERPADEQKVEFLTSIDLWFRPTQLANAPVAGGRTLFSDQKAGAGGGPVLVQGRTARVLQAHAMDGPFASRAFVLILGFVVDEVPLVEPTFSLGVGCQRLGHQRNDAGLFARKDPWVRSLGMRR